MQLTEVVSQMRSRHLAPPAALNALERYVQTGDHVALRALAESESGGPRTKLGQALPLNRPWSLLSLALPPAGAPDDAGRRLLVALGALGEWKAVRDWYGDGPGSDALGAVLEALRDAGVSDERIVETGFLKWVALWGEEGPTRAGRFVLSASDHALRGVPADLGAFLLEFLFRFGSQRVPAVVPGILAGIDKRGTDGPYRLARTCQVVVEHGGGAYDDFAYRVFQDKAVPVALRLQVGRALAAARPERYQEEMRVFAREWAMSGGSSYEQVVALQWLLETFGREMLEDAVTFTQRAVRQAGRLALVAAYACADTLGREAVPVLLVVIEGAEDERIRLDAVGRLVELDADAHRDVVRAALARVLKADDLYLLTEALAFAGRWDAAALSDELFALMTHRSKQVRLAAGRALARTKEAALPRLAPLAAHRKADVRETAAAAIAGVGTPAAHRLLEERLEAEEDDDIREVILAGLQAAWAAAGRQLTREEVEARAARGAQRLAWPPAAWVEGLRLPPLRFTDGTPVPETTVRYLLARQARCSGIRSLYELAPLYALIDRSTSADFALPLLEGFLASGTAPGDKWALTVAGILGDDRVVPLLAAQIPKWVDANRGKLAEYGVQALALLATDRALMLIDSLARRYRDKMRNVGAAAQQAFLDAAERLDISPEELGDRVVPWLGFEPGRPRIVDCAGRQIEARIGPEFKLQLRDVAKGKPVSSPPAGAPAEVKAEFKELGAVLREVAKAQTARMEVLMVRQQRWPAARWLELFVEHPLLRPFGLRLVWGAYNEAGALQAAFRALEDGTLTDRQDEPVTLPEGWRVGIIHPLEMDETGRQEWRTHLADYEIEPPFPQMERSAIAPAPEQAEMKLYAGLAGKTMNALTFRGRAEKLGWHRACVGSGGYVPAYGKSFPSAGADGFLMVDGMFVGIGPSEDVTLGQAFFVPAGALSGGEWYDLGDAAGYMLPFGQVPLIVFSEVMADLAKIAPEAESE